MLEIIPAIMPSSYDDFREKVKKVKDFVPLVQLDIMDGQFVASKSWPYTEGGTKESAEFVALMNQEEGLPYWDTVDYEIDLMIQAPEKHIEEWLPLGASRLVFHIESILDPDHFFRGDLFAEGARMIGEEKIIEIALAINPDTDLSRILPYLDHVDYVQVMGIAKIGYQGQPFDERSVTHIKELRARFPQLIISVDGAVNKETVQVLREAGATRLVSGSAVFSATDPKIAVEELAKL